MDKANPGDTISGNIIVTTIRWLFGQEIDNTRVYRNLRNLSDDGVITAEWADDRKNTKHYTATEEGIEELVAHFGFCSGVLSGAMKDVDTEYEYKYEQGKAKVTEM